MADDSDKPDFLTFWNGPEGDRMRRDLRHPRQPFPEELADRLEPYRGKPIPEALFDYLLVTLRGGVRRRSGHLARDPHEARDRATALRFAMEDYPGYLARVQQCKKRLRQSGKRKATANAL